MDEVTPTEHRSIKDEVKQGVQKVGSTVKPVLQKAQTGMKSGVHTMGAGLKTGVQGMQSGVKAGVQSVSNMWTAFKTRKESSRNGTTIAVEATTPTQDVEKLPIEQS